MTVNVEQETYMTVNVETWTPVVGATGESSLGDMVRQPMARSGCHMCDELAMYHIATVKLCAGCHGEAFPVPVEVVEAVLHGLYRIGVLPALPAAAPAEKMAADRMAKVEKTLSNHDVMGKPLKTETAVDHPADHERQAMADSLQMTDRDYAAAQQEIDEYTPTPAQEAAADTFARAFAAPNGLPGDYKL